MAVWSATRNMYVIMRSEVIRQNRIQSPPVIRLDLICSINKHIFGRNEKARLFREATRQTEGIKRNWRNETLQLPRSRNPFIIIWEQTKAWVSTNSGFNFNIHKACVIRRVYKHVGFTMKFPNRVGSVYVSLVLAKGLKQNSRYTSFVCTHSAKRSLKFLCSNREWKNWKTARHYS